MSEDCLAEARRREAGRVRQNASTGQADTGAPRPYIVTERLAALSQLAFFPQSPRFHLRLTCRQVARYYAQLRGLTPAAAEAALERWGLGDHLTAATAELSGGLRQRLALAVFSLAPVPVLVLDEPGWSLLAFTTAVRAAHRRIRQ